MSISHQQRMQKKKAVIDEKIEAATVARGVLVVHTGNGKGKSTAAFGVLARALGHGQRAAVVQFVKGRSDTGEEAFSASRQASPGIPAARVLPGKPRTRRATPPRLKPPGPSLASIWPIPLSIW